MRLSSMLKAAAAVQLARVVLNRRRRVILRRQRRNRAWGLLAAGAGAALAWRLLSPAAAGRQPAWPSRKKLRKEARREQARRAREQVQARPPEVHVEKDAAPGLKAPLGDLTR